jgi:hypothetical protein
MKKKVALLTAVLALSTSAVQATTVDYICPPATSFKQIDNVDDTSSDGYYADHAAVVASKKKVSCPINGTGLCATDGVIDSAPSEFTALQLSEAQVEHDGAYGAGVECFYNNGLIVSMYISSDRYGGCTVTGSGGTISGTNTAEYYNDGDDNIINCSSDDAPDDCAVTCAKRIDTQQLLADKKLPECYFNEQSCLSVTCREKIVLQLLAGEKLPHCYFREKNCLTVSCRNKISSGS